MTESDEDGRRRRYFEEYKDRVDRHREGAAFFEQRAIEFANSGLKVLAYLHGGGLLAIPAVVALFRSNPNDVKFQLVCTAAAFIAGLLFVALAQACAFFVMARRSEAEVSFQFEQMEVLKAVHYPEQVTNPGLAQEHRTTAITKHARSNYWRAGGLIFVCISLLLFVIGCGFGAWAVLATK